MCVCLCVCTYKHIYIHTHTRMDNSGDRSMRVLVDEPRQTDGWANGSLFGLIDKDVDR